MYNTLNSSKCVVVLAGGLGNQLFIIACGVAYSARYDKQFQIYVKDWDKNKRPLYFDTILCRFKSYMTDQLPLDIIVYKEPFFQYQAIPYISGDILLDGYFQSDKYFIDLIDPFTIVDLSMVYIKIKWAGTPVILHVRRSDYLHQTEYHPTQSVDYYSHAIKIMKQKIKDPYFLMISDDISFLSNIHFENGDMRQIVDMSDIQCIKLMAMCKHFIITNSTFSWWGSTLANASYVIAPKIWFGEKGPKIWHDVYRKGWVII